MDKRTAAEFTPSERKAIDWVFDQIECYSHADLAKYQAACLALNRELGFIPSEKKITEDPNAAR